MLPKGTTAQRPDGNPIYGVIQHTQTQQFEGYATARQGLGGVIDVDQNTKIIAEDYPYADNNELKCTAGHQRMIIDASNNIDISTNVYIKERLDVSGAAVFDNVNINNNFDISNGNFTVNAETGNTFLLGTFDVSGNMDLDGTLDVSGIPLENRLVVSGGTVLDSNALNVTDNFDINYGKFTVEAKEPEHL